MLERPNMPLHQNTANKHRYFCVNIRVFFLRGKEDMNYAFEHNLVEYKKKDLAIEGIITSKQVQTGRNILNSVNFPCFNETNRNSVTFKHA